MDNREDNGEDNAAQKMTKRCSKNEQNNIDINIGNIACNIYNTSTNLNNNIPRASARLNDMTNKENNMTEKDKDKNMLDEENPEIKREEEKSNHSIIVRLGDDGLLYGDLREGGSNVELSVSDQLLYIAQDDTWHNYDTIRRTLWPHLRFNRAAPYRYSTMTLNEFTEEAGKDLQRLYAELDQLNATAERGELLPNNRGCFFESQYFSSL